MGELAQYCPPDMFVLAKQNIRVAIVKPVSSLIPQKFRKIYLIRNLF